MELRLVSAGDEGSEAIRALVRENIDTDVPEPFGAYLFGSEEPGAKIARLLEREVFLEAFGNTSEQLAAEYGSYEASSVFFCVIDHRRATIAGMTRMMLPTRDGPGMKTLNDVESVWATPASDLFAETGRQLQVDRTWDIGTLAVSREYRSAAAAGLVGLGLYQSFVRTAGLAGVDALIMIIDQVVLRMLRIRVRIPLVALAEARPYLGSPASMPAVVKLPEWRERLGQLDPEMLGIIFEGRGIEPALRPIDLDGAAACVLRRMPARKPEKKRVRQRSRGTLTHPVATR